jgi:hypothetical protein
MSIGTLWRKARYIAAEALFRLGGFVEPKEPIDFGAFVRSAMASKVKPTPSAAEALKYQGIDPRSIPGIVAIAERNARIEDAIASIKAPGGEERRN